MWRKKMIGFDLQEVERIENEEKLLEKIALDSEIKYIQKFKCVFKQKVASLWAVKEAVFKALNIKGGDISFKEIELCHHENGAPFVKLYGKAKQIFDKSGAKQINVSISHQNSVVGAVVEIL